MMLKQIQKEWHGSLRSYLTGLLCSLMLTTLSFFLVIEKSYTDSTLAWLVMGLAFLQALLQLIFFLHVGKNSTRWEMIAFGFMVVILSIIALGTLWIMHDLNERVMPTMNEEISYD